MVSIKIIFSILLQIILIGFYKLLVPQIIPGLKYSVYYAIFANFSDTSLLLIPSG